jgi:hypothetical protein
MKKAQPLDGVPASLVEDLKKDAVRVFGFEAEPSVEHKKSFLNPYSDVHVFEISRDEFRRRVYVKIPRSEFDDLSVLKKRLIAEFRIMQKLNVLELDAQGYGVGIPFGYYPEYPAIATLEAGRKTLRMHYRMNARRFALSSARENLMREVANCGAWLRKFQELTSREAAPFDIGALVTYSEVRLKCLLKQNKIHFPETLAHDIVRTIHAHGACIRSDENRIVGRHNDFAGHNILVNEGKVWVIDFSMFDHGPSAYDPCNFWLELEMLKYDPTYSGSFLGAMQERFLASYGSLSPEHSAFKLARCRYTLNRMVSSLDVMKGWRPDAFYRRRVVREGMLWLKSFAAESTIA